MAYTPNSFSDDATLTGAQLNTEFSNIQTELNTLNADNFPSPGSDATVPNSALAAPKSFDTLCIRVDGATNGTGADADIATHRIVIPYNCTIVTAKFLATAVAGGAPYNVRLRTIGGTNVTTNIDIAVADTVYSGSIATASQTADTILVITHNMAGGRSITNLHVELTIKGNHTA